MKTPKFELGGIVCYQGKPAKVISSTMTSTSDEVVYGYLIEREEMQLTLVMEY